MTTDIGQVTAIVKGARSDWDTKRKTAKQLIRFVGIPQGEIAEALQMSRPSLNGRLAGHTVFQPWELVGIAAMVGVPIEVLDLQPMEAVRWVLDHPEVGVRTQWSPSSSLRAA